MALRIYNNLFSLNTQRSVAKNQNSLGTSLARLSSGLRINRAADDAAGLAISENLRSDLTAMSQAMRNANDGISMVNTVEGAMSQITSMLTRMRELATQAATGTVGSTDRATIQVEFSALRSEIDRITEVTEFNGQKLLDGSLADGATTEISIHVGFQATTNDKINLNDSLDLDGTSSATLGIDGLSVTTATGASGAIGTLQTALTSVTTDQGKVGALQSRFVNTIANLEVSYENIQAAESQIRDADYAAEISQFTRNQILVQASTSMLAQANLIPQNVLQLLG